MKTCHFIFLLLTLLMLASCNNVMDKDDQMLAHADSLMTANSDTAKVVLTLLNNMKGKLNGFSSSQRMKYQLLLAKAMNKAYVPFTSDSIMKKVVEYYDNQGSDFDKMQSHYLLGCVYRDLGDYPLATKCLYEATKYAGKDSASIWNLVSIHGQIASLLEAQSLVPAALQEYDVVSRYALKAGDLQSAIAAFNRKSAVYSLVNKMDSAALVNDSAIHLFRAKGYERLAACVSGNGIEYQIQLGNYSKAKYYIDMYEQKSGYFHNGNIEAGKEVYYYFKGLYYLGTNQMDSAEILFRKCFPYIEDPNIRVATYRGLSLLYQKMGRADSTAKYAMLCYEANDSAYQENTAAKTLQIQSMYFYGIHQEKAVQSAEQTAKLQRWLFGSFMLLIIIVSAAFYVHHRFKKSAAKRIALMKEKYETEKSLLAQEMDELNTLMEEKESLLESMGNQLELKDKEVDIEISKKENSIKELQARIENYERNLSIKDIARTEDKINRSSIRQNFMYYASHVTKHPTDDDWNNLTDFAKENLPKIYVMLSDNNVSDKEFKVTILIRLRFKPGEITNIINCTFPEVTLIRSRLLKKLYGIDGKAADYDRRIIMTF